MDRRPKDFIRLSACAAIAVGGIVTWSLSQTLPSVGMPPSTAPTTTGRPPTMNPAMAAATMRAAAATRAAPTAPTDSSGGGWRRRGDANAAVSSVATTQSGAVAARQPIPENFEERYGVIAQQNMFLRERVRRLPTDRGGPNDPTRIERPAPLENFLVLRGITLEDDRFRAYFENTQSNTMVRVEAGDAIARGHVSEISMDAVAFEGDGGQLWVNVGDNLAGVRVAAPAPTLPPIGAMSGTTASGAPLESVAERMRQARLQRQGGGGGNSGTAPGSPPAPVGPPGNPPNGGPPGNAPQPSGAGQQQPQQQQQQQNNPAQQQNFGPPPGEPIFVPVPMGEP